MFCAIGFEPLHIGSGMSMHIQRSSTLDNEVIKETCNEGVDHALDLLREAQQNTWNPNANWRAMSFVKVPFRSSGRAQRRADPASSQASARLAGQPPAFRVLGLAGPGWSWGG